MAFNDKCRLSDCRNLVTKKRGSLCEVHRYRWEKYKSFDSPVINPKPRILKERPKLPDGILKICYKHGFLNESQVYIRITKNRPSPDIVCCQCRAIIDNASRKKRILNTDKSEISTKRKASYQKNIEQRHHQNRKNKFNISKEQYQAMIIAHNYCCAICLKPETAKRNGRVKNLCIDHCHESEKNGIMKIRGLLCSRCNVAFGYYKESIVIHQNAIDYAKKHLLK